MNQLRACCFLAVAVIVLTFRVSPLKANAATSPSSTATQLRSSVAPTTAERWRHPNIESESGGEAMLTELGCSRDATASITRAFFQPFAFIVAVVLVGIGTTIWNFKMARRRNVKLANMIVAISLLLAVFQWRASLEQEAMQRFEL